MFFKVKSILMNFFYLMQLCNLQGKPSNVSRAIKKSII